MENELEERVADALSFLERRYSNVKEGWLVLWRLDNYTSEWLPVTDLEAVARAAVEVSEKTDVYLGVGVQKEKQIFAKRGAAKTVSYITGFWIDVDIKGTAHKAANLPPTKEKALEFIRKFELKPTEIIHSGHGLQVWWLLKEPFKITDEMDREYIQKLLITFQGHFINAAKTKGWKVDSTMDIARVLRVIGTKNHKRPENVKVVTSVKYNPTAYYSLEDFEMLEEKQGLGAWM